MIRTAELAIGMAVICFPSLPGILRRYARKSSQKISYNARSAAARRASYSFIHGSIRPSAVRADFQHRRGSRDEENTLVSRGYFELDEVLGPQAHPKTTKSDTISVISRVTGMGGNDRFSNRSREGHLSSKGIMRTISIEQSST